MNPFLTITIITFIAGVIGTGLGGVIGALFRKDSSKIVSLLLSFAAGVMLAVVCFDLIKDALTPTDNSADDVPFWIVIIFVLVGYLLVFALNLLMDKHSRKQVVHVEENHPKAHDSLDELIHADHYEYHKNDLSEPKQKKNSSLFFAGVVMAAVIALHNLPEGMVIGASFADDPTISITGSGLLMALVIGFHNIPEGMAVSVPLISGGTKKWKAVLITALTGLPTVVGAILGLWLGSMGALALSICLSLASGAMLYAVFGELLPESILMWKSKLPAFVLLIGLLLGLALVSM